MLARPREHQRRTPSANDWWAAYAVQPRATLPARSVGHWLWPRGGVIVVEPFRIHVADEVLDDLRARLRHTRWPDQIPGIGWEQGTELDLQRLVVSALGCILLFAQQKRTASVSDLSGSDKANLNNAVNLFDQGRQVFRFATFDDQTFWGDALKLHQAIEGAKFGGVGPGLSPKAALAVGLKVDVDALPASLIEQLKHGKVNLDDPAVTLALLKLNS